jgi:ABC-type Fe3+ transport system permease subunit
MGEMIDRDEEHLRLLKIGYYILAGINSFFVLVPIFLLGLGSLIASGAFPLSQNASSAEDPRTVGAIMLGIGMVTLVLGLAGVFVTFLTARSLRDHRRRTLCLIVAAFSCLYIPWGTAIGIATIMVLNRPNMRALFGGQHPPPHPVPSVPQV